MTKGDGRVTLSAKLTEGGKKVTPLRRAKDNAKLRMRYAKQVKLYPSRKAVRDGAKGDKGEEDNADI